MKMKVAAALAATMAVGATCAFAANPFVDVPTDSWAYKSVVELADSGIIQGVDGTHFEGGRNITRYEAAEIVAKAMAHMDKASVEQRALINKLADEYADELNNLGVRVSALENKVGNVKLTGDARIRYRYQNDNASKENDKSWDYRIRLRANAQVNDNTKVTYGLSSNNINFGSDSAASSGDDNVYTDIAKVDTTFGNFTASVGRTDAYVLGGAYGYQYGDVFDRAELKYDNGKFALTGGYGKFKENAPAPDYATWSDEAQLNKDPKFANEYKLNDYGLNGMKTGYVQLQGFFGNGSSVGVYYNDFTGKDNVGTLQKKAYGTTEFKDYNPTDVTETPGQDSRAVADITGKNNAAPDDLWGAYASVNFGSKWNLLGDYQQISHVGSAVDDSDVWVGKLTYGKASMAAPKSWDIWVEYLDADPLSSYGSSLSWRFANLDNVQSWGAGIDYTFAKNAMFSVMTSFATDAKDSDYGDDPEEQTRAQFVFAF